MPLTTDSEYPHVFTTEEQQVEKQLLNLYDRSGSEPADDILAETIKDLLQRDLGLSLITLLYKRQNDESDRGQWVYQKLQRLVQREILKDLWFWAIKQLPQKDHSLKKIFRHFFQTHTPCLSSTFNAFKLYAGYALYFSNLNQYAFCRYAQRAFSAYDQGALEEAADQLFFAGQIQPSAQLELIRFYWQYVANQGPFIATPELAVIQAESTDVQKLLLIYYYQQSDFDQCLKTAAKLSRAFPNYPFLALPALLALKQGELDKAYEVIYSLIDQDKTPVEPPIIHKKPQLLARILRIISHLQFHNEQKTAKKDNKTVEKIEKTQHRVPSSKGDLWRIMTLLAITHIKQAHQSTDPQARLDLYQRAQNILLTSIRYTHRYHSVLDLLNALQQQTKALKKEEGDTPDALQSYFPNMQKAVFVEAIEVTEINDELKIKLDALQNTHPDKIICLLTYHKKDQCWCLISLEEDGEIQRTPVLTQLIAAGKGLFCNNYEKLKGTKELEKLCEITKNHLQENGSTKKLFNKVKEVLFKTPKTTNIPELSNKVLASVYNDESFIQKEYDRLLDSAEIKGLMDTLLSELSDRLSTSYRQSQHTQLMSAFFGNTLSKLQLLKEQLEAREASTDLPLEALNQLNADLYDLIQTSPLIGHCAAAMTYRSIALRLESLLKTTDRQKFSKKALDRRSHFFFTPPDFKQALDLSQLHCHDLNQLDAETQFKLAQYYSAQSVFFIYIANKLKYSDSLFVQAQSHLLGNNVFELFSRIFEGLPNNIRELCEIHSQTLCDLGAEHAVEAIREKAVAFSKDFLNDQRSSNESPTEPARATPNADITTDDTTTPDQSPTRPLRA